MAEPNLTQMILTHPNLAESRAPGVIVDNISQLRKIKVLNLQSILARYKYMRLDTFDHAQGSTVKAEEMNGFIQDVIKEWDTSVGDVNPPELRTRHFSATHVKVGTFRMYLPPSKNA
ncbi:hypothetical protein FSARC_553 [Fusarium sarcochroum]|uniref:Uncharacterized protein n=1 Tax=Fusarium sarcochroum TaxID=1208366 RepID=A0A8H4XG10_9HYPO|nr:hypothetical protein FSARC_553 [Fusarium sarcochroum]